MRRGRLGMGGKMRNFLIVAAVVMGLGLSGSAHAQQQTVPIQPAAVVQPTTNTIAGSISNTIKGFGTVVSGTLENNAIVRTLNNLLGKAVSTPTQPGYSALPDPRLFPSTKYPNSFKPTAPVMSTYGQSPTAIFPKK